MLAIGAPGKSTGQGATYIYSQANGAWTQQAELIASDGAAGDQFGRFISMDTLGVRLAVGAPNKTIGANANQGSAYVFIKSGSVWTQETNLYMSAGAANDYFGISVCLSASGNLLAVGSNGSYSAQGSVNTFILVNGAWKHQTEIKSLNGVAGDQFGYSVVLDYSGTVMLVNAYRKTIGANTYQGAVYRFVQSGGVWTQQAELTSTDGAASDYYGLGLGISSDGSTIAIGAPWKAVGANNIQGAVYTYTLSKAWAQTTELIAADGAAGDYFGTWVSMSRDGSTVATGAGHKTVNGNLNQGAIYVAK